MLSYSERKSLDEQLNGGSLSIDYFKGTEPFLDMFRTFLIAEFDYAYRSIYLYEDAVLKGKKEPEATPWNTRFSNYYTDGRYTRYLRLMQYIVKNNLNPAYYISTIYRIYQYRSSTNSRLMKTPTVNDLLSGYGSYRKTVAYDEEHMPDFGQVGLQPIPYVLTPLIQVLKMLWNSVNNDGATDSGKQAELSFITMRVSSLLVSRGVDSDDHHYKDTIKINNAGTRWFKKLITKLSVSGLSAADIQSCLQIFAMLFNLPLDGYNANSIYYSCYPVVIKHLAKLFSNLSTLGISNMTAKDTRTMYQLWFGRHMMAKQENSKQVITLGDLQEGLIDQLPSFRQLKELQFISPLLQELFGLSISHDATEEINNLYNSSVCPIDSKSKLLDIDCIVDQFYTKETLSGSFIERN